MVNLATISWRMEAFAAHWMSDDELSATTAWMADNYLILATAERPVVVRNGKITYGKDRSDATVRRPNRDIMLTTVVLRTPPLTIRPVPCDADALAVLTEVFQRHEWSTGFGGACVTCTPGQTDDQGRVWGGRDDVVTWPCPAVADAMAIAGVPIPNAETARFLGDCLSERDNAQAFNDTASPAAERK
jgi:hypothetical protein